MEHTFSNCRRDPTQKLPSGSQMVGLGHLKRHVFLGDAVEFLRLAVHHPQSWKRDLKVRTEPDNCSEDVKLGIT